ncbi:carbohydrate ABC transporter permease [Capillibacterium thermochitinicola]|uniref:Carbohydrate ABC transporter permease n=1 Tax=Capillibacterium thermochitinicola TaxID=2699427 RepID=A0A8J6I0E7_9FIRM|nr:carbohydrate ABC transporter permease [Capillibacterium thermochitinicola]MBA2133435.1 carbohydrate ABC transporter permease [Capillibacterium thermochitinicola]
MKKVQTRLTLPHEIEVKQQIDYKKIGIKILLYLPLLIWTVVTIYPFWYMVVLSTRSLAEIFAFPPPMWFGRALAENYRILLDRLPFWRNVWNSVYIAVMATITTLFFCSVGGYGFAVYEFRGKKLMFNIMLATMMIPALLGIIPFFIMMSYFGWINTPRALYIPGAASAYGIYLMRQYITSSVPLALVDAARIDGCSEFAIYRRIVLPIIKPGLGALGIITFLGSWDNFMGALVILRERMTYTIPVALRSFQGQAQTDYGAIMVGASIAVIPLVIVFLFMSKQLIAGLTYGAIKG